MAVLVGQGWSAEPNTHFDLPHDIPGYMPDIYEVNNFVSNLPPNTIRVPLANNGDQFIWVQVPQTVEIGNLYFPVNGHQPTTPEAVIWSCANIDNRGNSPITEWYMQMFGWHKDGEEAIEAGFDENNGPRPILKMNNSMYARDSSCLSCRANSHVTEFWQTFRQIASNSVGRVLLYRLLIEIRRRNNTNAGCAENAEENQTAPQPRGTKPRSNYRKINIKSGNRNAFSYNEVTIEFCPYHNKRKMTTVCQQQPEKPYRMLGLYTRPDDIGLFHEMLHWYHLLRAPRRFVTEKTAGAGTIKLNGYSNANGLTIYIGAYYWNTTRTNPEVDNKYNISATPWKSRINNRIQFEEIRTILGSNVDVWNYMQGDDLSENLYRATRGSYMRFGHSTSPYYEDEGVIQKAISSCNQVGLYYRGYHLQCVPIAELSKKDQPDFPYNIETGIGGCKIKCPEL